MPGNDNKKNIESNNVSETLRQHEQDNSANDNNLQDEEAQLTVSSLFDEPSS